MLRLSAHFARLACVALEWGGETKTWDDGFIVATLVILFVLTVAFTVTEWLQGPRAMLPLSLLKSRMTWINAWIYLQ
jgi:MFS transporter, DHA2 family, glioxin efflux transporter